ncbi:HAD-IA family hydrolase [Nocardia sp. NPDC051833]|uniref:HAD-IA family hydrolase n=1 Tax=Nocardia sp. NPDC051833 TaxID=3155674 RepID=UPI0034486CAF
MSADTERTAVLIDFGGVLTTSMSEAFRQFGASIGDPDLPLTVLTRDDTARRLFVDHESGLIGAAEFDAGFAARLRSHGARLDSDGISRRVLAALGRDDETVALLSRLRNAGVPVALVSNAFGRDPYQGFDLDALADVVVVSSEVGVRKPSRRIYAIACERLGTSPQHCVMVDDLQQNLDGAARLGIAGVLHVDGATTARLLAEQFGFTAALAD